MSRLRCDSYVERMGHERQAKKPESGRELEARTKTTMMGGLQEEAHGKIGRGTGNNSKTQRVDRDRSARTFRRRGTRRLKFRNRTRANITLTRCNMEKNNNAEWTLKIDQWTLKTDQCFVTAIR